MLHTHLHDTYTIGVQCTVGLLLFLILVLFSIAYHDIEWHHRQEHLVQSRSLDNPLPYGASSICLVFAGCAGSFVT